MNCFNLIHNLFSKTCHVLGFTKKILLILDYTPVNEIIMLMKLYEKLRTLKALLIILVNSV